MTQYIESYLPSLRLMELLPSPCVNNELPWFMIGAIHEMETRLPVIRRNHYCVPRIPVYYTRSPKMLANNYFRSLYYIRENGGIDRRNDISKFLLEEDMSRTEQKYNLDILFPWL